jgi:hypothetical protein
MNDNLNVCMTLYRQWLVNLKETFINIISDKQILTCEGRHF